MARGAAEGHQRPKGLLVVEIALAALDRAQAHKLAVELAALHGEEERGGAGIAAHDIDVEPENLLGDDGKDQVARGRAVGAEIERLARLPELVNRLDWIVGVDE